MRQASNKYPVVMFTVVDSKESLLQTIRNIGFGSIEEMFEWALKEYHFYCEVTLSEKWDKVLIIAKGDYGFGLPNTTDLENSCEMFGITFDRFDIGYYKKG